MTTTKKYVYKIKIDTWGEIKNVSFILKFL